MTDWAQAVSVASQIAASIIVVDALNRVQNKYNQLALKYYSHYETQRQFYFNTFQAQGEAPFVFEQFGITFYSPDYVGMDRVDYLPPGAWYLFNPELTNRVNAMGNSTTDGYWPRFTGRYTPSRAAVLLDATSYAMDLASVIDDWNSYINRYEEHKRDVLNERRWGNMVGALEYGTKHGESVEWGLATSFAVFDKAQGEYSSSLSTIANGLATHAGYRRMQSALKDELGTDPQYMGNFFLDRQ
jgi:hypothetical protein